VSVIVNVPTAVPTVSVTVPVVALVIVAVPRTAPVPPVTLNSPTPDAHAVPAPVTVSVCTELRFPLAGEMLNDAGARVGADSPLTA
jgi:hypothetical protein